MEAAGAQAGVEPPMAGSVAGRIDEAGESVIVGAEFFADGGAIWRVVIKCIQGNLGGTRQAVVDYYAKAGFDAIIEDVGRTVVPQAPNAQRCCN